MSQAASKFLAYVLRHRPDAAGLTLDAHGWADVDAVLAACAAKGHPLDWDGLVALVDADLKQRYALDEAGARIRANQGHSVDVDLGLKAAAPPDVLFHGTVAAALDGIRARGILKGTRHHVHLSALEATARQVGARRGAPVILRVDAAGMARDGHVFYRSANGVWLVDAVPVGYFD